MGDVDVRPLAERVLAIVDDRRDEPSDGESLRSVGDGDGLTMVELGQLLGQREMQGYRRGFHEARVAAAAEMAASRPLLRAEAAAAVLDAVRAELVRAEESGSPLHTIGVLYAVARDLREWTGE